MEYQLSSTSMAPLVEISLDNNEEIQIESGAMVYHNAAVKLEGKMNSNGKGGLGGALKLLVVQLQVEKVSLLLKQAQ